MVVAHVEFFVKIIERGKLLDWLVVEEFKAYRVIIRFLNLILWFVDLVLLFQFSLLLAFLFDSKLVFFRVLYPSSLRACAFVAAARSEALFSFFLFKLRLLTYPLICTFLPRLHLFILNLLVIIASLHLIRINRLSQ